MKIAKIILAFSGVFLCVTLTIFAFEHYYLNKFEKTELKISEAELQILWGNPDRVITYVDGKKNIFYYTICNEFVFNTDSRENVELKYKENF